MIWICYSRASERRCLLQALPQGTERTELLATVARITGKYDELTPKYHSEKAANPKNTMAFN